ncbi:DUF429 domain-containing protein [Algisphaera agarilytica]|uniref:Putative nuclease with RNAse H fold n=1 Tax=Algisphaera agarilytica TaxID=1385975 RepID=A0A7X0LJW7_9BACT|nr:DUF429 domain-containing protein [Algisphaera agarilytica]MBB6428358.1 putative nuclease with RNAse H fold [Algisphaera agarilytica]
MPPTFAIDLGSKLAGTTVVVQGDPETQTPLSFHASAKKQDADAMIASLLSAHPAATVYLDAPLSLPGVYRQLDGFDDFHLRRGDRELTAMSPMFLGGLTARAMRLSATHSHCVWHEVYPAAQAKRLELPKDQYKKSTDALPEMTQQLASLIGAPFDRQVVATWHHFDALLAWLTAERHATGEAQSYGHPDEGVILV